MTSKAFLPPLDGRDLTKAFRLGMVCGLRAVIENWNVAEDDAGCAQVDPGAAGYVRAGHAGKAAR